MTIDPLHLCSIADLLIRTMPEFTFCISVSLEYCYDNDRQVNYTLSSVKD